MKKFIIVIVLMFMAIPAFAGDLQGEVGLGFGKSIGSEIALLRYQVKSEPLFGFYSYNEALLMSWNGDAHASAVGFAKTICFKTYYTFSTGGLLMDKGHTENLGTPLEFYFRFAYDITPKVSLGLVHISNGNKIFGWNHNHNNGENFLTISAVLF